VQASTDRLNWTIVKTNTLPNAPLIFSDPNWRNYPQRFYRLIGQRIQQAAFVNQAD
jgi:hypothetical protein